MPSKNDVLIHVELGDTSARKSLAALEKEVKRVVNAEYKFSKITLGENAAKVKEHLAKINEQLQAIKTNAWDAIEPVRGLGVAFREQKQDLKEIAAYYESIAKSYGKVAAAAKKSYGKNAAAGENFSLVPVRRGVSSIDTYKIFAGEIEHETANFVTHQQRMLEGAAWVVDDYAVHFDDGINAVREDSKSLNDELKVTTADLKAQRAGYDKLTRTVERFQSILTGLAIVGYVKQLREALAELKAVDTELVTIQKVTGQTRQEVQGLADAAFSVATKYGATAPEYLSSVASFARAGYGEFAQELGELSLMTQKVGDVNAETADQFLLSVDAAYQYKGSVEELTKVLDGANEIGNKFATDVNKITAGLGIVSNVAKQANVDIDEVTAALGTITATTQRSGSEAARALRAIYLNIAADISTELDEDTGDHWTAEEVEAMASSLQKFGIYTRYVKDGMEQLRNPMEVIGEIAEKVKSGMISEVELNDLLQGLGGKLRSNQLLALINNWDMYTSMLDTYRTAAGSAEEELSIYLDSWEAKAKKFTAAWAEMVNNTLNSGLIKWFVDFGTSVVQSSGSLLNFTTAFAGLLVLFNSNKIGEGIVSVTNALRHTQMTADATKAAIGTTTSSVAALGAAAAGLAAVIGLLTFINNKIEENRKKTLEAADAIDTERKKREEAYQKYKDIHDKLSEIQEKTGELSENEQKQLADSVMTVATAFGIEEGVLDGLIIKLGNYELALEKAIDLQRSLDLEDEAKTASAANRVILGSITSNSIYTNPGMISPVYSRQTDDWLYENGIMFNFGGRGVEGLIRAYSELEELQAQAFAEGRLSEAREYDTIIKDLSEDVNKLRENRYRELRANFELEHGLIKTKEAYEGFLAIGKSLYGAGFERWASATLGFADATNEATDATDDFNNKLGDTEEKIDAAHNALTSFAETFESLESGYASLEDAVKEFNESGAFSASTFKSLVDSGLLQYLHEVDGSLAINEEAFYADAEAAKLKALADIQAAWASDALALAEGRVEEMSAGAQSAIATMGSNISTAGNDAQTAANKMLNFATATLAVRKAAGDNAPSKWDLKAGAAVDNYYRNLVNQINSVTINTNPSGRGGGGGSSRSYAATERANTYIEVLKAMLEDADFQVEQWTRDGGKEDAIIAMYERMMREIESVREKYLAEGYDETSDEVQELTKLWWKYADTIEDIHDDIAKQVQNTWDELDNAIDAEIDALKKARDIEEDQLDLEEKRLAVLEAEQALLDARNDRSVRKYNADGSWEWVADERNIQSVQEAYDKARETYDKALQDKEYADLEAEWEAIKKAIEEPGRDIAEILNDIATIGTPAMKEQVDNITSLLGKLGYDIAVVGAAKSGGVTSSDSAQINKLLTGDYSGATFDSGGVAGIKGIMLKNTQEAETVLPPSLTKAIISPQRNAQFSTFTDALTKMFGMAEYRASGAGTITRNYGNTDSHDTTYTVNGVQIGWVQAQRPFYEVMRDIVVYTNPN